MDRQEPPAYAAAILDAIQESAEQFESAKRSRVRLTQLGRDAGLKWEDITPRLGITRASAIQLLQRANR